LNTTFSSKVGVSIRKRLVNSVKQNRIRRLIKEFFRKNKNSFSDYYNLMFIVKKDISNIKYSTLEKDIIKLLKKKNVIR